MDRAGFSKKSVIETISFEFISGLSRRLFEPHRTDWRVFPYTVIVCAFDSAYVCEISNEGTYTIYPGEALIVPGGLQHRMLFEKRGFLNCLHIKYTVFRSMDILSFFEVPRIIMNDGNLQIPAMVDDMADGMINTKITLKEAIRLKAMAMDLLNIIMEESNEKDNLDNLAVKINTIQPVLDYVHNNLNENISRKVLADILSLSETRFHYVFKSITGVSPMKYVQIEKLHKAYIMISASQDPLYEISAAVGYSDYSNFTRRFKDYFGETPSEIRDNINKRHGL